MKKNILYILLLSFFTMHSKARDLNIDLIKSRLDSLTITSYGSINKPNQSYDIILSKGPRMNKSIKIFSKNKKDISQIAFFFYICGTSKLPYPKTGIHSRKFFKQILKQLFLEPFPLSRLYIKELNFGESFFMKESLKLKVNFKKVRIKKERYKCDSQGGEGYRLDLFL
jgi:hypothetical protein